LGNILSENAATQLAKIKINTSEELLANGLTPKQRKQLSQKTGLPLKQLTEWIQWCDLMRIKGVGPVMAKLFSAAGVATMAQMQGQKAGPLYKAIMAANQRAKITQNPPGEKNLENWIEQAKKLKVVVR
jgi:predicted flap endonuclease-1-like 5' DNA nuclease